VASLLALAVAAGGCSAPDAIPPPTQLGPRIEAVRSAVFQNESLLKEPIEEQLGVLDKTVMDLSVTYGYESVGTVQALSETASLLATKNRFDLALPYMEHALAVSRDVYGLDHRETAYALHDVAILLTLASPGDYLPRAELLFRGAAEIRRRQAGADEPETGASEAQLAWQLLLGAKRESLPHRKLAMLVEAEQLALHARRILLIKSESYWFQTRRIAIEGAFARGDYAEVQRRARDFLKDGDYEKGPGYYPDQTGNDLLIEAVRLTSAR
jgi:hypothetical protein